MKYGIALLLALALILSPSCKKDSLETATGTLNFSTDTITFDTIFATIGSITKTLTVYNNNNFDIKTNIQLQGYSKAYFRMNVDGMPGDNHKDIKINANDSIFIFLEVTINPSDNNTPYILADSIIFTTGDKQQSIKLIAWGQDAYFHLADTSAQIIDGDDTLIFHYHHLDCSQAWNADKPHVIYGYAIIDPGDILTINAGADIYFHKNSGIIVGNPFSNNSGGTIKVYGELSNEVTFQGDRLDSWYRELPGQWDRIWITPGSIDNEIHYAIIKNGNVGIHVDTIGNNNPTLIINNTIIKNMSSIGIFGQGANISGNNLLISNCGQHTLACNIGGTYNFTHCTFVNYWISGGRNRTTPSILINNYYEAANGNTYDRDLHELTLTNCIIHGNLSTEISFQKSESAEFNYNFINTLIKLDPSENTNNSHYTNCIINENPDFVDPYYNDYHLKETSPAINAGLTTLIESDIEGNNRQDPDLGLYEFQD